MNVAQFRALGILSVYAEEKELLAMPEPQRRIPLRGGWWLLEYPNNKKIRVALRLCGLRLVPFNDN